mmetsp:Transcript_19509/g.37664  ORF Transcript_19509/g.37664 Transcript_19509/m.37664 type:complete len:97 (-) Transcript_19509:104-394(-)
MIGTKLLNMSSSTFRKQACCAQTHIRIYAQSSIELDFNHPVKEIFWVEKEQNYNKVGEYIATYHSAVLQLDGQERFSARITPYFQLEQPHQHRVRV